MTLLDGGVIAWFVAVVTLLVLQQFASRGARTARFVLVPVAVLLTLVFGWKIVTVFAPIVQFEVG